MTVTIFGATGTVGKELVRQCQAYGYRIKAFGRNTDKLIDEDLRDENFEAIRGSVFNEEDILKAVTGSDAVLTALGGAMDGEDVTRSLGIKNIVSQMTKAGVPRIIAVGGEGCLDAPEGGLIMESPTFPLEYVPVSQEHMKAYAHLAASSLTWTFVCPPQILDKTAEDSYTTRKDKPGGGPAINAGNLAVFMVSELSKNEYVNSRVGISNNF